MTSEEFRHQWALQIISYYGFWKGDLNFVAMFKWYFGLFERFRRYLTFYLTEIFLLGANIWVFLDQMTPTASREKNTCLECTSLCQTASLSHCSWNCPSIWHLQVCKQKAGRKVTGSDSLQADFNQTEQVCSSHRHYQTCKVSSLLIKRFRSGEVLKCPLCHRERCPTVQQVIIMLHGVFNCTLSFLLTASIQSSLKHQSINQFKVLTD